MAKQRRRAVGELTPEEVAAMWLCGADYARSGKGASQWWADLQVDEPSRADVIRQFVARMELAFK